MKMIVTTMMATMMMATMMMMTMILLTMMMVTMMMVMMGTWQHRPQDRNADVGGVELEKEGEIGSAETSTDGAVENSVCSQKSAYLMLELG